MNKMKRSSSDLEKVLVAEDDLSEGRDRELGEEDFFLSSSLSNINDIYGQASASDPNVPESTNYRSLRELRIDNDGINEDADSRSDHHTNSKKLTCNLSESMSNGTIFDSSGDISTKGKENCWDDIILFDELVIEDNKNKKYQNKLKKGEEGHCIDSTCSFTTVSVSSCPPQTEIKLFKKDKKPFENLWTSLITKCQLQQEVYPSDSLRNKSE